MAMDETDNIKTDDSSTAKPAAQLKDPPLQASKVGSEDKELLQNLVEQSRGVRITNNRIQEMLPEQELVTPLTKDRIKSMKAVSAKQINTHISMGEQLSTVIIKTYCDFLSLVTFSKHKVNCLLDGHECLHCGQKFPSTGAKPTEKDAA